MTMADDAEQLRWHADWLRGAGNREPLLEDALAIPSPRGDPDAVRAVSDDARKVSRGLSDAADDLDRLRTKKLPEVWEGGQGSQKAGGRLRAASKHAEHACQVFHLIGPCLHDLADKLETAQTRDRLARERIQTMISSEQGSTEALAAELDEMAAALESASDAVGEAARELNKYAGEAGTMWLTQVQLDTPGLPIHYRDDRMPVEEILLRYQQPPDPRGMVECNVTLWMTERMTATECDLIHNLNYFELRDASSIRNDAWDQAESRYPGGEAHDGPGDAWRHAYWSARMSQRFGEEWADQFTTAHEGAPSPPAQTAMDLHNNAVGLRIARENPDATPEELAQLVARAVENGETVAMAEIHGTYELYYTDQTPPTGD